MPPSAANTPFIPTFFPMHQESPQFILAQALAYRDRLQFEQVVALCDPQSIAEYFRSYCDMVRIPTDAELAERLKDVPNNKSAAFMKAMRRRSEQIHTQIPRAVPGTGTYAELIALGPDEFVLRALKGADFRCSLIRAMRQRGDEIPLAIYEPPDGVIYDFGIPETMSNNEVRVRYSVRLANGSASDTDEYEDLRRNDAGEWRLLARHGLLESRGATAILMTTHIAELIQDKPV